MTELDLRALRQRSLEIADNLGYQTNESLPLLDEVTIIRSIDEVVDRVLAMECLGACAYGFDNGRALEWLRREAKSDLLTPSESRFLQTKVGDSRLFMEQIEGIWALAWSLRIVSELDFGENCANDFVYQLPDLKRDAESAEFRDRARMRDPSEVVSACDLAYCIHWAIRESELRGRRMPGSVPPYVIVERRRALEWLLTSASWNELALDT